MNINFIPLLFKLGKLFCRSLAQIRELKETHSLRRMYANVVLVNRDTQLFKRLLALLLHLLRPLHLLLPGFVETLHELLTRLQLFLQLRFRHSLDCAILRLVRDLLLGCGDLGIVNRLTRRSRNTRC